MRIGRLQINWLKAPLPKIERKLEMEYFYTTSDGTNWYTYKMEDLARISGRYLDNVKNTLNFMLQYGAGPDQVKAFSENIANTAKRALEGEDRTKALIKIHETASEMPKLQAYVEDIHKKQWYDLVEMFFVIDGEDELLFTPKFNNLKRQILEKEVPEVQEVFFLMVQGIISSFSSTYREDLLASMVQQREMAEVAASLTSLTTNLNTKSTLADGPASESKSTEITPLK